MATHLLIGHRALDLRGAGVDSCACVGLHEAQQVRQGVVHLQVAQSEALERGELVLMLSHRPGTERRAQGRHGARPRVAEVRRAVYVGEQARDRVTELHRPWLLRVPKAADRFLGRRPGEVLAAERVALLVCRLCVELRCGQLTAVLDRGSGGVLVELLLGGRPVRPHAGAARAERVEYESPATGVYERVAAFPFDELAHRARRFS